MINPKFNRVDKLVFTTRFRLDKRGGAQRFMDHSIRITPTVIQSTQRKASIHQISSPDKNPTTIDRIIISEMKGPTGLGIEAESHFDEVLFGKRTRILIQPRFQYIGHRR